MYTFHFISSPLFLSALLHNTPSILSFHFSPLKTNLSASCLPQHIRSEGVGVIVSLCEERQPHTSAQNTMDCHLIPVEEFEDPTMEQITQFLDICDKAHQEKKV